MAAPARTVPGDHLEANLEPKGDRTSMAPSRGPEPLARALHNTLENHKGPVHVARYAKGSAKYLLTGGQDRVVRLWNPNLGTEIKSYSAHGYEVLSISV
jgi:mitogen-activated protein kinase organizer 1